MQFRMSLAVDGITGTGSVEISQSKDDEGTLEVTVTGPTVDDTMGNRATVRVMAEGLVAAVDAAVGRRTRKSRAKADGDS